MSAISTTPITGSTTKYKLIFPFSYIIAQFHIETHDSGSQTARRLLLLKHGADVAEHPAMAVLSF